MKKMTFSKVLPVVACALVLCVSVPILAVADQAQYIYDTWPALASHRRQGNVVQLRCAWESGAMQQGLRRNGATLVRSPEHLGLEISLTN